MGINNAENQIEDALINRIASLERDFTDFKTTPQRIGNGSMNWAIFGDGVGPAFSAGPTAIPAGGTQTFTLLIQDASGPFTYAGQPAINRMSSFDLMYTIAVDTNDTAHIFPYGASLTSAQSNVRSSWWYDYAATGLNEASGQRYTVIQITNTDSTSHNYYLYGTALIPRPALKPQ